MKNKERNLILNYLNAAYRLAFHEDAGRTQEFLTRLISFLRYYLNDEVKLVRLKDELNYLGVFLDIYEDSTGRKISQSFNFPDEILDLDLPAKTLIILVQELLVTGEEQWEGPFEVSIQGYLEQENVMITLRFRQ